MDLAHLLLNVPQSWGNWFLQFIQDRSIIWDSIQHLDASIGIEM